MQKKTCNKTLQVEFNMLKQEFGDVQKNRKEERKGEDKKSKKEEEEEKGNNKLTKLRKETEKGENHCRSGRWGKRRDDRGGLHSVHGRTKSNEKLVRVTEERQEDNQENKNEIKGGRNKETEMEGRQRS